MNHWISAYGESVFVSPHYHYLMGNPEPMIAWMYTNFLGLRYASEDLMKVLQSMIKEGQKEPIWIYKDMRINTGHKRSSIMAFLGYKTIKAVIVSDSLKL